MKRIKNLLSVLLMALIALSANAQKEVKVTSDVPYCTDSPSQVLDIAEPVNFGSEGLRPAIVIIHGEDGAQAQKATPFIAIF